MDLKKSKEKNQRTKNLGTFAKCLRFPKKKIIPWGMGFKNLSKIYSLDYGFLLFVISISDLSSAS
jgi:hypothetical protein